MNGKSKRKGDPVNGWLVVDKPLGVTSTQVVGAVRRLYNAQKVGHGGTLDPLASGILPVALGEATKTVSFMMDCVKAYRFTLRWGQATQTDDAEGEVVAESERRPTEAEIKAVLGQFTGPITQIPPRFSAIKLEGQRAYDLARADKDFELKAREVMVHDLTLIAMDDPDHATFSATCGKGTYMRALGRDLGVALGTCAHVSALRRTRVGPFDETGAISLESLQSLGHSPAALEQLLPVETALDDIPALALSEAEAQRLRNGQAVLMMARSNLDRISGLAQGAPCYVTSGDRLVALARFEKGAVVPVRIFNL